MKVLVTGGTGKIGTYVVPELAVCHEVSVFCRHPESVEGVESVAGSVLDLERLVEACRGMDVIVHLAAAVPGPVGLTSSAMGNTPERMLQVNVMGTVHILEAAVRENVGKVVLASSNAATGYWLTHDVPPDYLPLDERHPCRPRDPYGLSKLLNEVTCRSYSEAHGLRTICLRISNGRYLDREGAAQLVSTHDWGADSPEELWDQFREDTGNPSRGLWRFWVYVDARDVASAFRLAVENDSVDHGVFFLSASDTFSRYESGELLDRFFPVVPIRGDVTGHTTLVSHAEATSKLGWEPRHSWREHPYLLD